MGPDADFVQNLCSSVIARRSEHEASPSEEVQKCRLMRTSCKPKLSIMFDLEEMIVKA